MTADDDNRMLKTNNENATANFLFCSSEFRYVRIFHYLHYVIFFQTF